MDARDRGVRRDSEVDGQSGRQKIAALWDAWEVRTPLAFTDVDNDADTVTYRVVIEEIEEKAAKPSDAGRWGESVVALTLAEV